MHALLLVLVTSLIHLSFEANAQPVNVEAAKKEGKVILYGTVPTQSMDLINKPFEKKYGIRIEYWRASATQVTDRALNEWRAGRPNFDVLENNPGLNVTLKTDGGFARYMPPSSENFPEQFKDKEGLMTVWRIIPLSILYNTDLVREADRPRSFDDLIDPKWRKKLALPDPTRHAQTAEFLWNLRRFKGDTWLDFVKALARQEPHMVESFAPVPAALTRGEAHIGIGYIKFVKQFKGPFNYVVMDKHLAIPNVISLGAKAANPNAGRLFMEYICSADGQRATAEEGEFVLYPGINPPIKDADKVTPRLVFMDNATPEQLKKVTAELRQIFFKQ